MGISMWRLAIAGTFVDFYFFTVLRAIKLQHESEGEEQRKKEAAAAERKRKADEKDQWENGRENRVQGERRGRRFQQRSRACRAEGKHCIYAPCDDRLAFVPKRCKEETQGR